LQNVVKFGLAIFTEGFSTMYKLSFYIFCRFFYSAAPSTTVAFKSGSASSMNLGGTSRRILLGIIASLPKTWLIKHDLKGLSRTFAKFVFKLLSQND
jgi:hypothetical protein